MEKIGLIISGNLTGFSRFYTSAGANRLVDEANIDFDCRNYLTFLENDEKSYVVSFSKNVVAVSLVTRILDSFRRPGILVVSLLIPRQSKIEMAINKTEKFALYRLLNEINSKFHEKNFLNGMLNQNAAVLMQDYYSDILASYVLVPDYKQRNINSMIDVTVTNKSVGYVKTEEANVPKYLTSMFRKSFDGYHHIVFAKSPIQNIIDESPEETVIYTAFIKNNGLRIPGVKLSDKIYRLSPSQGEVDFEMDYTYKQVLEGHATTQIKVSLDNETIEMNYLFRHEEKTVRLLFYDGTNQIPFFSVQPVLEIEGKTVNIPSETYTFQGREIYQRKKIKASSASGYTVKPQSEYIDISRVKDGSDIMIQVESSSQLILTFNPPFDKPKIIELRHRSGRTFSFQVTSRLSEPLPGRLEDYSFDINSQFYERSTGVINPNVRDFGISLRQKSQPTPDSNLKSQPQPRKQRWLYWAFGAAAVLVFFLAMPYLFSDKSTTNDDPVEEFKREILVKLKDTSDDGNDDLKKFTYDKIRDFIQVRWSFHDEKSSLSPSRNEEVFKTFTITSDDEDDDSKINVAVYFGVPEEDKILLVEESIRFCELDTSGVTTFEVILPVAFSQLTLVKELLEPAEQSAKVIETLIENINNDCSELKDLYRKLYDKNIKKVMDTTVPVSPTDPRVSGPVVEKRTEPKVNHEAATPDYSDTITDSEKTIISDRMTITKSKVSQERYEKYEKYNHFIVEIYNIAKADPNNYQQWLEDVDKLLKRMTTISALNDGIKKWTSSFNSQKEKLESNH